MQAWQLLVIKDKVNIDGPLLIGSKTAQKLEADLVLVHAACVRMVSPMRMLPAL